MIKCLAEFDLKYCGDSIEWCPVEGYRHLFICGSYQLNQTTNHRDGRIELFSYTDSKLQLVQGLELEAGLLDAKWAPNTSHNLALLAAALSNGVLNIYKLDVNNLSLISSVEVCSSGMALSVDWSTGVTSDSVPKLVVSQSDGKISVVQMNQDSSLNVINSFKAHDYEAWIAAFNYWNTNIIYTGGDDCKLNVFDTRQNTFKPIHTDSSHGVGITSIQCNQKYEGYIVSGSYENIQIWKSSSTLLESIDKEEMSGGTWRVKWNIAGNCGKIAVAAMHNGFSILDYSLVDQGEKCLLNNTDCREEISFINNGSDCKKKRFDYKEPHQSLGYGIDWSFDNCNVTALCSFYDKKLSVALLE